MCEKNKSNNILNIYDTTMAAVPSDHLVDLFLSTTHYLFFAISYFSIKRQNRCLVDDAFRLEEYPHQYYSYYAY